jgi:electron transfer DM13
VLRRNLLPRDAVRRVARKPIAWVVVGVLAVGLAFGLYWFAPWKLFTSKTVNEQLADPVPAATQEAPSTSRQPPAGPVLLRQGQFISHEHSTSGTVRVVQLADGRRQLELINLSTSDGPDLRVWLSDQAVVSGMAGWGVFNEGVRVEVGKLKGNKGNQMYEIPSATDLNAFRSVTIWCVRFSVSFGAAELI